LHCYRYIELNPVRARMTTDPLHYPWSSHASNAFGRDDPLIRPHETYLALGADRQQRCTAYRALTLEALSPDEVEAIRSHLQRQHALGPDRFRVAIEAQLSRRAGPAKIGRPRKPEQRAEQRGRRQLSDEPYPLPPTPASSCTD
jgi:putative transposase